MGFSGTGDTAVKKNSKKLCLHRFLYSDRDNEQGKSQTKYISKMYNVLNSIKCYGEK